MIRRIRSRDEGRGPRLEENHGYSGSKGAQVGGSPQAPDPGLCSEAANRGFAKKLTNDARKRFDSPRIALGSRQPEGAELDEVATRNGDIQASVPDQGYRSP